MAHERDLVCVAFRIVDKLSHRLAEETSGSTVAPNPLASALVDPLCDCQLSADLEQDCV